MKSLGFIAILFSLLLIFIEAINGFGFSTEIAKTICGESYLKEVNDMLTDQACGFDADMQWVAFCVLGIIVGLSLLTAAFIRKYCRSRL